MQNWNQVLRSDPHSLSGLGGMAYAKYHQGLSESARGYIARVQTANGRVDYSPLLFVEKMLEETAEERPDKLSDETKETKTEDEK